MPDFTRPTLLPVQLQVIALVAFDVQPKPFTVYDLHFEWSVKKTIGPTPDECVIRITNLGKLERELVNASFTDALALYQAQGAALGVINPIAAAAGVLVEPPTPQELGQVSLLIGWNGKTSLLFSGAMTRIATESFSPPDTITEVVLSTTGPTLRDALPPGGSSFGMVAQAYLALYANAAGLRVPLPTVALVNERASQLPLASWRITNVLDPRVMLDQFFATLGLNWAPVGNAVVVYDGGVRNELPVVRLTPGAGLLSVTPLDEGGFQGHALANPALEPGGRVVLSDGEGIIYGGGPLWVQAVEFTGNNDGESVMTFTARKLDLIGAGPHVGYL